MVSAGVNGISSWHKGINRLEGSRAVNEDGIKYLLGVGEGKESGTNELCKEEDNSQESGGEKGGFWKVGCVLSLRDLLGGRNSGEEGAPSLLACTTSSDSAPVVHLKIP